MRTGTRAYWAAPVVANKQVLAGAGSRKRARVHFGGKGVKPSTAILPTPQCSSTRALSLHAVLSSRIIFCVPSTAMSVGNVSILSRLGTVRHLHQSITLLRV